MDLMAPKPTEISVSLGHSGLGRHPRGQCCATWTSTSGKVYFLWGWVVGGEVRRGKVAPGESLSFNG